MDPNGNLVVDSGAPVVAPQPAPVAQPAPVVAAPMQQMPPAQPVMPGADPAAMPKQDGWNEFFRTLNWVEMGFMILGAAGLYYTIYYYRYKLREDKVSNMDIQRQLDELKMNVQPALKGKYKSL